VKCKETRKVEKYGGKGKKKGKRKDYERRNGGRGSERKRQKVKARKNK